MKVERVDRKRARRGTAVVATIAALSAIALPAAARLFWYQGQTLVPEGQTPSSSTPSSSQVLEGQTLLLFEGQTSLQGLAHSRSDVAPSAPAPKCEEGNGGISLPAGFCATIFADKLGAARHPVVAPNGDVYIALAVRRSAASTGGIAVLRDTDDDGKADQQQTFGVIGGGGLALGGDFLFVDARTAILRYRLTKGVMVPTGEPDTIVSGLPSGGHSTRDIALDGKGNLFVNVGSMTNVCLPGGRGVPQIAPDPCPELEARAGVWKFSATQIGQKFSPATRFVTGLRNGVGLKWNARDNALYATQHGRDQLFQQFPQLYDQKKGAENPAEELMKLEAGDDFGWPYCYYDIDLKRLVLAPEYGGDAKMPGRCTNKKNPVVAFPGHWAPNAVEFYSGTKFPAKYRDGAFVAFHGSWNRAPEPQGGFKVAFAPAKQFKFDGTYEVFADGFGGSGDPAQGPYRPTGLTTMPDGSLLITDDKAGRVWKVIYTR